MMKYHGAKNRVIASILALAVFAGSGFCQTFWKRIYGGIYNNQPHAVTQTADGNYIAAGATAFYSVGKFVSYLMQIDLNGDTVWTRQYNTQGSGYTNAICALADSSCISVGSAGGSCNIFKIAKTGDMLWNKNLVAGEAWAIAKTGDGGYLLTGRTNILGTTETSLLLVKVSQNGELAWTKTYAHGAGCALVETSDQNFLVVGINYTQNGNVNSFIAKIKPNGDTLWTKTYGAQSGASINAIATTADGNVILAGSVSDIPGDIPGTDMLLVKIDMDGKVIWNKTYGGAAYDAAFSVQATTDQNILVVGSSASFGNGIKKIYLVKVKSNGDTLWTKAINDTGKNAIAISPTSSGDFIGVGVVSSSRLYYDNFYFSDYYVFSVIDDKYAYSNKLFTYKIPRSGDSMGFTYNAIDAPQGMTVSNGGTISWIPPANAPSKCNVSFEVANKNGRKDTLSFYIYANNSTAASALPTKVAWQRDNSLRITQNKSSVVFRADGKTNMLGIYNAKGCLIDKIRVLNNVAVWDCTANDGGHAGKGRYFVRAIGASNEKARSFMLLP
jgi:hypothetical protein